MLRGKKSIRILNGFGEYIILILSLVKIFYGQYAQQLIVGMI